jgi:uncharacterized membrane protein YccC
MKLPSASELLFSARSFAAAMLALYIGLRIGLPRPFWAMLTAYVVSNPFSGAVRSKALFRVGGTVLGSIATVLLVPALADAPELLSLALALWVGVCLYISLLDRTPRSYVFMLAGYTAALIGFPTVSAPATVFDVALARVEEITLGITCATLVHSLFFPRSLGPVLLARLDRAIRDAQHWIGDALRGDTIEHGERDRRQLAGDITELRLMSTHLPFDTSNLRWTSDVISRLQDRLATMVPLLSAIEDRLHALRAADSAAISPRWRALLDAIAGWGRQPVADAERDRAGAAELRASVAAVTPPLDAAASWSTVLQANLAARLLALVNAWEECRALRREIDAGFRGGVPSAPRRAPVVPPRALHRDRGLALLSAFAAVIAILGCCAFWIVTAWPSGAAAPMMAAVFCCFFATQDDPVPGIMAFLNYTILSIPVSALYLLVLLPAIHSFEMLVLVTAPVFLLLGVLIARPATGARAMAFLFGVAGTLSLQDTGTSDLVSFINGMLGQLAGIGAAVIFTRLLRTVSADWTARRLLRAGWAELAALGQSLRAPSIAEMSARMVDRIGLLTPRLAIAGPQRDLAAVDALSDLRVGLNMTQLLAAQPVLPGAPPPLMQALSAHFRNRAGQPGTAEPALLAHLDDALRNACAHAQREAVAALVGIRRDLFPHALPYQASMQASEAAR